MSTSDRKDVTQVLTSVLGLQNHFNIWCTIIEIRSVFLIKLVSAIFYQMLIVHQMIALQKLWKKNLFHLKSSFRSWDIQIFVFSSSPLFFPVSHCFRGWFKKNVKVCDVIICLNKDLITHFVWYFEKEIRCYIEILAIDRLLNTEHFYEKLCRECAPKASPRPFFNFAK